MEKTATSVIGLELKQLLIHLSESKNICFRFRIIGEMWMKRHMRVSSVNEKTALFYDEVDNKYYQVKLNNIIQFDLDDRFQNFLPHFHYTVSPSSELD